VNQGEVAPAAPEAGEQPADAAPTTVTPLEDEPSSTTGAAGGAVGQ
jgi:hypothetical protein